MGDPRLARDPRRRAQQAQQQQQQSTPPPPPPTQPETSTPPTTSTPQPQAPPPPPASPPPDQLDGASDNNAKSNGTAPDDGFKLKFCTVCASNNNRSMEAHLRLSLANFPVISFGTGSLVRLPGPSITQPYVYPFNVTSYEQMHTELSTKDARMNRANGVLNMLERNKTVKFGPERWQDWAIGIPRLEKFKNDKGALGTEGGVVDVVITCEERCWDAVVDNLLERGSPLNRPVHVINVDIKDSHEEALVGGKGILDLATSLNKVAAEEREKAGAAAWDVGATSARTGFDQRVPEVLASWQERWPNLPALWTLSWL